MFILLCDVKAIFLNYRKQENLSFGNSFVSTVRKISNINSLIPNLKKKTIFPKQLIKTSTDFSRSKNCPNTSSFQWLLLLRLSRQTMQQVRVHTFYQNAYNKEWFYLEHRQHCQAMLCDWQKIFALICQPIKSLIIIKPE